MRIAIAAIAALFLLVVGAHAQTLKEGLGKGRPPVYGWPPDTRAHAQTKTSSTSAKGGSIYQQAGAAKGAIRGIMQNEDVKSCSADGWPATDQCTVIARAVMLTLVKRCKEYGECPELPLLPSVTNAHVVGAN